MKDIVEQTIDLLIAPVQREDIRFELTDDAEAERAIRDCIDDLQRVLSVARKDKLDYLKNVKGTIIDLINYYF